MLEKIQNNLSPVLNPKNLSKEDIAEDEWKQKIDYYMPSVEESLDSLQTSTESILASRMFGHTKTKIITSQTEIDFLKVQIEREKPEGIALSLSYYRPYFIETTSCGPSLSINLVIEGAIEIDGFRLLYSNYRRIIEMLINREKIYLLYEFSYYEPEIFFGKQIFKHLDAFFLLNDYKDKNLSFSCSFQVGVLDDKVLNSFVVLSALYDSCINYLTTPKRYDKLLHYFNKIESH